MGRSEHSNGAHPGELLRAFDAVENSLAITAAGSAAREYKESHDKLDTLDSHEYIHIRSIITCSPLLRLTIHSLHATFQSGGRAASLLK